MSIYDSVSVIIPSLDPTDRLEQVVSGLIGAGFCDIILVNDGSDEEHTGPFDRIKQLAGCTVLTHPENMGKGAALKTAFNFCLKERTDKVGVVTVDGDGQHLVGDVVNCAVTMTEYSDAVVMGVRNFKQSAVPKRNSLGNRITAFVLRVMFGIRLRDTQTGLRGIPTQHIPLMLEIAGSRFEYETNMILELKRRNIPFHEVAIETVYEEGSNDRSHFRPLKDSVMIFARIAKYAMSSILCFFVDIGAFWLAIEFLGVYMGEWSILFCTVIARAISSFLNFNINRRLVFQRRNTYGSHFLRYYSLAVVQMLVAAGGLWLLSLAFGGAQSSWLLTLLKIMMDTVLFFLSYFIQRNWVFKEKIQE